MEPSPSVVLPPPTVRDSGAVLEEEEAARSRRQDAEARGWSRVWSARGCGAGAPNRRGGMAVRHRADDGDPDRVGGKLSDAGVSDRRWRQHRGRGRLGRASFDYVGNYEQHIDGDGRPSRRRWMSSQARR
jgi:hypothetical protein